MGGISALFAVAVLEFRAGRFRPLLYLIRGNKIERWLIVMRKLFTLKNGRLVFYACVWDCGMYSIERITKSFGGTVATFETVEELKKYAKENNYKIA